MIARPAPAASRIIGPAKSSMSTTEANTPDSAVAKKRDCNENKIESYNARILVPFKFHPKPIHNQLESIYSRH